MTQQLMNCSASLPLNAKRYQWAGWLIILIGLVGFSFWAAFAPLDKGGQCSGQLVTSGNRKTVQAPISGIINSIKVKEGELVKQGQILLQLDQRQLKAQQQALLEQFIMSALLEARIQAEKAHLSELVLLAELNAYRDLPQTQQALYLQQQLLQSRRHLFNETVTHLQKNQQAYMEQIQELQRSQQSKQMQANVLQEKLQSYAKLLDKKYIARHDYLNMQHNYAEIMSDLAEIKLRIVQLQQQLQDKQSQLQQYQIDYLTQLNQQLSQAKNQSSELKAKLVMINNELRHTTIYAPVQGYVVGLTLFTQGGVVTQGQSLLDIAPDNVPLMIEAKLPVNLIDSVKPGLAVEVMLSTLNQATTPKLAGKVSLVSADVLTDHNQQPYYLVNVQLDPQQQILPQALKAGMPVEVFIKTGSRTLLDYLFKPLMTRLNSAMTEV